MWSFTWLISSIFINICCHLNWWWNTWKKSFENLSQLDSKVSKMCLWAADLKGDKQEASLGLKWRWGMECRRLQTRPVFGLSSQGSCRDAAVQPGSLPQWLTSSGHYNDVVLWGRHLVTTCHVTERKSADVEPSDLKFALNPDAWTLHLVAVV